MAIGNVYYYQDPDYADFYWIKCDGASIVNRGYPRIWVTINSDVILIQNFQPAIGDLKRTTEKIWVTIVREKWLAFMERQSTAKVKQPLKPNPAIAILQRLSGLDEPKLREIIAFEE